MSMIKVIPPGSYDWNEEAAQLIKVASTGLRGNDLASLIKRAGHGLAEEVRKMAFAPGEVPVHMIAVGATEVSGINRNGDGFTEACCDRYHDTFKKHARFYRSHSNKDPKKSYGLVKLSTYNKPMGRIELIVALNGTKEAAKRNGGLLADEEVAKLEKNAEFGVSMACSVKYDVCSGCGNKARNRSEYCTGGTCKYGGLKDDIGVVYEDGHHLHADNPHPKFFDISRVFRPADRIAFVHGKVASSNSTIGGAQLAELMQVSAPYEMLDELDYPLDVMPQIKLARELAALESSHISSDWDKAFTSKSIHDIEDIPAYQRPELLRALATEKIALSVTDWLKMLTNASEDKCAEAASEVSKCLPDLFTHLIDHTDLPGLLKANPSKPGLNTSERLCNWATKQASDHSLDRTHVLRRVWRSEFSDRPTRMSKTASAPTEAAKQLAYQYGAYQISLLHSLDSDRDRNLYADLIVRMNRAQ